MDRDLARQLLDRERERLEQAIAALGHTDPEEAVTDNEPGERDSEDVYQREFDGDMAQGLADRLAAVERAEARLAAGTYGVSIESGKAIPDARLEANPAAERTVEEQERLGLE